LWKNIRLLNSHPNTEPNEINIICEIFFISLFLKIENESKRYKYPLAVDKTDENLKLSTTMLIIISKNIINIPIESNL
jgi:hypothetical protein